MNSTPKGTSGTQMDVRSGDLSICHIAKQSLPNMRAAMRDAEAMGLKVGDDVVHATFGEGVILLIEGEGDKAETVIRFPGVGEKRLLLSWAPIKKA